MRPLPVGHQGKTDVIAAITAKYVAGMRYSIFIDGNELASTRAIRQMRPMTSAQAADARIAADVRCRRIAAETRVAI